MKVKIYLCKSCKYEFRYYKKIISCAVCGSLNSIMEKRYDMNKTMIMKTLEDIHFAIKWSGPHNDALTLRMEDCIKYLKRELK